ncbi:MAG: hypothetical protein LBU81_03185 [Methanosarcinales archaeon]|jgi:predicted transglutaminase-like cysteine proteinase|nr:hypothetical protein [Methanosarcinales archaeon]
MVRDARGIVRFLSACFIAFAIVSAALIAAGVVCGVYFYSPSEDSNIPIDVPSVPEPVYEETETPSSLTSADESRLNYSSEDMYVRTYSWTFGGYDQSAEVKIPADHYDFYRNKSHAAVDIDHYALTEDDRLFLEQMINVFKEQGEKYNFTDDQNVQNIIAFVQAMPYTSDSVTTGYDEYPRYPIETLVDGGDCEDSSILAAALLLEMGYGVVLIELPGHMALGVKGSEDLTGAYYEHDGSRYYYVETTAPDFEIGELPAQFINAPSKVYPMDPTPAMGIRLRADYVDNDWTHVNYKIRCDVINAGPTSGQNVTVVIMAESEPFDMTRVWSQSSEIVLGTLADDGSAWAEYTVRMPRQNYTRFTCVVYGDNFNPEYVSTKVVYMN